MFFYGVVMQAPDYWMVTGINSLSPHVVSVMSFFIIGVYA